MLSSLAKTILLNHIRSFHDRVSRDKNACKNIGLVFESEERPKYLCDTYDRDKKKEYFDLVPKKVNSHTPTITEGTNVPLTIE